MILERPLESRRLLLRTLTAADADGLYLRWMNDPTITKYLESRYQAHGRGDLEAFITGCNDRADTLLCGIVTRDDNRHIGNIKIGPLDARHKIGDIGIVIGDPACWGKGYASEAIGALVDHAFGVLNLHKVTAGCYASNIGSLKAFLAQGFTQEGLRRQHYWSDGQWEDAVMMGRLNQGFAG